MHDPTQGEWHVRVRSDAERFPMVEVLTADGAVVATLTGENADEVKGRAALIAQAPALYRGLTVAARFVNAAYLGVQKDERPQLHDINAMNFALHAGRLVL